jgi:hypothetical protein
MRSFHKNDGVPPSKRRKGYIYVVARKDWNDKYKIGYTTTSPGKRIYRLYDHYDSKGSWIPHYVVMLSMPYNTEQDVHRELSDYREGNSEIFNVNLNTIVSTIIKCSRKLFKVLDNNDVIKDTSYYYSINDQYHNKYNYTDKNTEINHRSPKEKVFLNRPTIAYTYHCITCSKKFSSTITDDPICNKCKSGFRDKLFPLEAITIQEKMKTPSNLEEPELNMDVQKKGISDLTIFGVLMICIVLLLIVVINVI